MKSLRIKQSDKVHEDSNYRCFTIQHLDSSIVVRKTDHCDVLIIKCAQPQSIKLEVLDDGAINMFSSYGDVVCSDEYSTAWITLRK